VLAHLDVRKIKSLQVGDIDICPHDLAALTDPFGYPDDHRPPACSDLKAPPARLDQLTSSARERVEDTFQEGQPIVFGLLAPSRCESVTRLEIQRLSTSRILALCHAVTIFSGFPVSTARSSLHAA